MLPRGSGSDGRDKTELGKVNSGRKSRNAKNVNEQRPKGGSVVPEEKKEQQVSCRAVMDGVGLLEGV